MSSTMIIGIALGVLLAALVIAYRTRARDMFGGVFVVGIAALAIAVTIVRVQQYHQQHAAAAALAQQNQLSAQAMPAPLSNPPVAPVALPTVGPMVKPPTGAAAPPAAPNPHFGKAV